MFDSNSLCFRSQSNAFYIDVTNEHFDRLDPIKLKTTSKYPIGSRWFSASFTIIIYQAFLKLSETNNDDLTCQQFEWTFIPNIENTWPSQFYSNIYCNLFHTGIGNEFNRPTASVFPTIHLKAVVDAVVITLAVA